MSDTPPPFSPGLIAGLFLKPVPVPVLDRLLNWAFNRILAEHPTLFDRLPNDLAGPVLITVSDLRLTFALNPTGQNPGLRIATETDQENCIAGISGPLQTLIDLMEGRVDGDALFFSRELRFTGDTEIVVALRNALDGIDIRLTDMIPLPPLPGSTRSTLTGGLATFHKSAIRDLEMIRAAITAPEARANRQQKRRIVELEEQVSGLEQQMARSNRKAKA
jgi:O2-independent ubiquinone biosynthesis accessory factor UbiT